MIYWLLLVTVLAGCRPVSEYSLFPEFRQIHRHYKGKPDHQAAAAFLLSHLRYHRCALPGPYERYCDEVDSIYLLYTNDSLMNIALAEISGKYHGVIHTVPDAEQLSAEYLIQNIDTCLEHRERMPWLRNLSWEEFCEYYLPYKFAERQALDDWRTLADLSEEKDMRILNYRGNRIDNPKVRYKTLHKILLGKNPMNGPDNPLEYQTLRPDALAHSHGTNCFARAYAVLTYCRANGIASAVDYTPSWARRGGVHAWISVITPGSQDQSFEPWTENIEPGYFMGNGWYPSKVYRMGWSPRPVLVEALKDGIHLPAQLSHLFVKDVTDLYNKTYSISIRCRKSSDYVWLSTFDGNRWCPIDIAKVSWGHAVFQKVTTGLVYCLLSARDGSQVSGPFVLDASGCVLFLPTEGDKITVELSRKFLTGEHIHAVREYLGGVDIYGSEDGVRYALLGSQETHCILSESVPFRENIPIRYIRLVPKEKTPADIAEVFFYDQHGKPVVINEKDLAFDKDPLTYLRLVPEETYTIDLGETVILGHASLIRRGDGNDIFPGDTYELYYNDGHHWQFIGRQTATDIRILFKDVPSGPLLWIRDISSGQENGCFFYEEGLQTWI